MSQTNAIATDIPVQVQAYAREQQVEAYLPVVVDLAREHFPSPDLSVVLEEDPAIEDLRHIVICTGPLRMSVEEALAAKDRYHRALFAHVPAPLICNFRLGLELAS